MLNYLQKMISEKQAITLLKKYSTSETAFNKVLNHVKAVQKVALRIASRHKDIDMNIIRIGSLLHDIGRFTATEKITHGIIGAEILRKEGLESLARICERHIGAGITKEEIIEKKLPLPKKDFVPKTKEEKIIAHADNLIFGDKEVSFDKVVERFRKELGEYSIKKFIKLKNDVLSL